MKTLITGFVKVVGALLIIAVVMNSLIRVSDNSGTIGIVEDKLWGYSIWDFFEPPYSDNYKRWKSATDASEKVADLLEKFGSDALTLNSDFESHRQDAIMWSKIAYEDASTISEEYLNKSNEDLASKYSEYFVKAVDAWKTGLSTKNTSLVNIGIEDYNNFLTWMHSKSRDDFKSMR